MLMVNDDAVIFDDIIRESLVSDYVDQGWFYFWMMLMLYRWWYDWNWFAVTDIAIFIIYDNFRLTLIRTIECYRFRIFRKWCKPVHTPAYTVPRSIRHWKCRAPWKIIEESGIRNSYLWNDLYPKPHSKVWMSFWEGV
jgi:hypothetical protein